ncbi:MAG: hypothetical protein Q7R47_00430, partial [Candidatus Diapherotrites archaeon]|nr:hypothetical protein [Candidatus Diapherotrites archaeon]
NPKIPKKADYLSSDTAVKSNTAVRELYDDGLPVHYLYKILSAGTLGVWVIRETVRKALQKKPLGFSDMKLALEYIGYRLKVPLDQYLGASKLLSQLKSQKKISDWF